MNNEEKVVKTCINWYPGHMARAKREIAEAIKQVDVVVELVDARIPIASRNPILKEIIGNKPSVIALNKADLAEKKETQRWLDYFKNQNGIAVEVDSEQGEGISKVTKAILQLMTEKLAKMEEKRTRRGKYQNHGGGNSKCRKIHVY